MFFFLPFHFILHFRSVQFYSFFFFFFRPLLIEKPDIVIGTPTRILAHINVGNLSIADSMEMLVIDEADLLLSFGYESDMKALMK